MSWTEELYKIYEQQCGRTENEASPLLPISHTTMKAQIKLTLSEQGDFISAERIEKADAITVVPVTEAAGARTSGVAAFPLADKLVYIAQDYPQYVDGKRSDNDKYFKDYLEQLERWANSEYSHPAVAAILAYVSKGQLMHDLISAGVLEADADTSKLAHGAKIAGIAQEDSFVRFRVIYKDERELKTWCDKSLFDAFIAFNTSMEGGEVQLCYALGKQLPVTYKHPKKICSGATNAKLISTNDENGFSYRGRFANKEQAASVSYEFSQKAHNALIWLINRQGITLDSMTLIAWEGALNDVPDITADFYDSFAQFGINDDEEPEPEGDTISAAYKDKLQKSIFGCKNRLEPTSKTMLMALDAATTGRLSMCMYTEMQSSDFFDNEKKWHSDTAWVRYNSFKKRYEANSFSFKDIAECAFGTEQNGVISCKSDIKRDTYMRLIPCVIQNRPLPQDIVSLLVNRASNPQMYDKDYNWRRVLETACGMIRKKRIETTKEDCSMALDKNCNSRDYLFGRLLAVADKAEYSTYEKDDKRTTNARRYFSNFANSPAHTWQIIRERLEPYLEKMSEKQRKFYDGLIHEITDQMNHEDFSSNQKLKPEYLHAYSCQLRELTKRNDSTNSTNDNTDNNEEE